MKAPPVDPPLVEEQQSFSSQELSYFQRTFLSLLRYLSRTRAGWRPHPIQTLSFPSPGRATYLSKMNPALPCFRFTLYLVGRTWTGMGIMGAFFPQKRASYPCSRESGWGEEMRWKKRGNCVLYRSSVLDKARIWAVLCLCLIPVFSQVPPLLFFPP